MAWMDCIERALAAKKITGKKADEARDRYANLYKEALADGMAPIDAEDFAAEHATGQIEAEKAAIKKKQLAQMAWSIDDYRQWKKGGAKRLLDDASAVIEGRVGSTPGRLSLNDNTTTYTGRLHSVLTDLIDKYSPKLVGLHYPKAGLENIVREVFKAGSTGDAAAAGFGKAWVKATDYGVRMYTDAGGILNHLEDWRMPQRQNRTKLYKLGGDDGMNWIADHMGWLDWDKMRWPNGARIAPAEREGALREAFYTQKTGGDYRIKPGTKRFGNGGGAFDKHRFLVYKDSDSWLAMHAKYGDGSIYEAMMSHIDMMGRRIGTLKTFGPSPTLGLEQMISNMKKVAADADVANNGAPIRSTLGIPSTYHDEATKAVNFLKDAFQVKVAGMNTPENGPAAIAAGLLAGNRQFIMSSVLGSTYLWQGTQDFYTAALRYRLAGLPVFKSVATYAKLFLPTGDRDQMTKMLMRAGFINYAQSRIAHAYTRMTGFEPQGSRIMQRLSDTVMRAGLVEWHAAAARFTTAAEFTGAFADWRALPFDQVPGKAMFEAHGITAADWDALRSTPLHVEQGHEFIFPDDHITHAADGKAAMEVADKFMAMINQEAKMATIEAQTSSALTMKGTTRPGTLVGEIVRSGAMFKNFPLTVWNTHIRQGLLMPTVPGKIGYIAQVVLGMTLFGAVGVALHDIAGGKNPESMFDRKYYLNPEFWTRAALGGGGLGIVGDYLSNNLGDGSTGLGGVIAGPQVEMASDLRDLTIGDATKFIAGHPTHFNRDLVKFLGRWMPGDTLWWLRAPLRAIVWDQLLKMSDPQAAQVFARREQSARKNGQTFWWRPGQVLPSQLPDLTDVVRK
jgi:hypothetical protein